MDIRIWHKSVPFKMAFLTWRAIHDRLSTGERVSRMGISLVERCYCCRSPTPETTEYLFCLGTFAKTIWSNFCAPFGISCRDTHLLQLLHSWWNLRVLNIVASFIAKILPQIIMWELWRSRCASKYGSELPSIPRSMAIISFNLSCLVQQKFGQLQMETIWEKLQRIVDQPITHRMYKVVKWSRPPPFYYKLNSDGSCVEGACGAGGVIRDCNGTLVMAYSVYFGQGTSNWAEGHTMLLGL
uniref:Reverse transcriptase zinc-binding domain-containing protein n=1 Tax=Nicotiana tabacum TaxID=4097 RepID=A0A1S3WZF5_TOBAC|nr:PREDICTED: uncharacterized protein LOC107759564 [Nicotiana tabacum]